MFENCPAVHPEESKTDRGDYNMSALNPLLCRKSVLSSSFSSSFNCLFTNVERDRLRAPLSEWTCQTNILRDKVLKRKGKVIKGETQTERVEVSFVMDQAVIISLASILTSDRWMMETVEFLMIVSLQLCLSCLQHRFEYIPWVL